MKISYDIAFKLCQKYVKCCFLKFLKTNKIRKHVPEACCSITRRFFLYKVEEKYFKQQQIMLPKSKKERKNLKSKKVFVFLKIGNKKFIKVESKMNIKIWKGSWGREIVIPGHTWSDLSHEVNLFLISERHFKFQRELCAFWKCYFFVTGLYWASGKGKRFGLFCPWSVRKW